ncbi:hypothetical protein T552_03236 [Pneumocystis carinii B80]|uniref:Uncharacterized protein n=1 Tax=Pneumocystis carinii (strain B80) TaxID=1408658 RepID=A0A0W4ZC79_PNEC8|nr:hypothetical protein T552_03236 [Pneumocystis carinii B80]KTW25962.1 hypothetical protein T552_03236 [Pneumocystis carinii B80]
MEVQILDKKSKELLSNQWIKEFFSTKEFPSVPEISRKSCCMSSYNNSGIDGKNPMDLSLSKRPNSLDQMTKECSEYLNSEELNSNSHIKCRFSSIPIIKNIENISSDQKKKLQDYNSIDNENSNDYKEIKIQEHQSPEKRESSIKINNSGIYDTMTLINYIQHEFSTWLKHTQKDKHLASSSNNLHDIAKSKYRQIHHTRKIIRSLSLVRLQLLSL